MQMLFGDRFFRRMGGAFRRAVNGAQLRARRRRAFDGGF